MDRSGSWKKKEENKDEMKINLKIILNITQQTPTTCEQEKFHNYLRNDNSICRAVSNFRRVITIFQLLTFRRLLRQVEIINFHIVVLADVTLSTTRREREYR